MEEKTKKRAKTVAVNEAPVNKISYEELEQIAKNLNQQCQLLHQRLHEAEMVVSNINEVGLLLSIIKESEYFDDDFIQRCVSKIQDIITTMFDNAEDKGE